MSWYLTRPKPSRKRRRAQNRAAARRYRKRLLERGLVERTVVIPPEIWAIVRRIANERGTSAQLVAAQLLESALAALVYDG